MASMQGFVAEASGDFVDALQFLNPSIGTIIRLLSNKQTHQSVDIGCINNLYQSVQSFNTKVFWNDICKKMLLCPSNPCEKLSQKLRFNVDDTEPTKYLMEKEIKLQGEEDDSKGEGVFVRAEAMYLIFDDLLVLQNSPGNAVPQLVQLGYIHFTKLTEISPNVSLNQILDLLKRALISKSPLSDVFLALDGDGGSEPISSFTPKLSPTNMSWALSDCDIHLKITVSKSKNEILYAEAEADFSDFLFSFLTMPLGSIFKLLYGNVTVGSMHNPYKSVKGLSPSSFTRRSISSITYTPFLDLKVVPPCGCTRQPLKLSEEETPTQWYGPGVIRSNICYVNEDGVIWKDKYQIRNPSDMKPFDPRFADGRGEAAEGFVRRPALFAVMDHLQVMPLTSTSSVSFLQKLNVPLDDLEEHAVKIGLTEALNLLGASLTSKAALTNGLFYLLKMPKEEATA